MLKEGSDLFWTNNSYVCISGFLRSRRDKKKEKKGKKKEGSSLGSGKEDKSDG
jgi:hypothetical protein